MKNLQINKQGIAHCKKKKLWGSGGGGEKYDDEKGRK